jgi:hypothetical protein
MRPRGIVVALITCVALLATAPAALAQSISQDAYCVGCATFERHEPGKSSLPFTGMDIALVVAAGGALLAAGFGVRRLSRTDTA